jgi:quinol---cytochrome c reductase iron-sulfur subunit, bacillus type
MSRTQNILIKGPLPPDQLETERRGFLKLATVILTFLVGLTVGIPVIGNVVGPIFRTKKPYWAKVAELDSLPAGQPVKLIFVSQTVFAYIHETVLRNIWVVKHSPTKVTVFSPICPHLGCEYSWNTQTSHFECPCHGSVFALDGKVLAGPAPRPLDTLPTRLEGGQLLVEWERFKIGIPEKIAV